MKFAAAAGGRSRDLQRADWVWRSSGWHGNGSVRHGDAEGCGPVASVSASVSGVGALTPQRVNICVGVCCCRDDVVRVCFAELIMQPVGLQTTVISVTATHPAVLLKGIFL